MSINFPSILPYDHLPLCQWRILSIIQILTGCQHRVSYPYVISVICNIITINVFCKNEQWWILLMVYIKCNRQPSCVVVIVLKMPYWRQEHYLHRAGALDFMPGFELWKCLMPYRLTWYCPLCAFFRIPVALMKQVRLHSIWYLYNSATNCQKMVVNFYRLSNYGLSHLYLSIVETRLLTLPASPWPLQIFFGQLQLKYDGPIYF